MKKPRHAFVRMMVLAAVVALVAAACGSSSKKSNGNSGNSAAPTGSVIFGAEQWPDCVNPINQCANSSWLQWLVPIHVLPRLTELDDHNNFVASPLLTEMPSTSNGGVTGSGSTYTVTYHLNPDAKWEPDGTPITSADVVFSWHAQIDSTGAAKDERANLRKELRDLMQITLEGPSSLRKRCDLRIGRAHV